MSDVPFDPAFCIAIWFEYLLVMKMYFHKSIKEFWVSLFNEVQLKQLETLWVSDIRSRQKNTIAIYENFEARMTKQYGKNAIPSISGFYQASMPASSKKSRDRLQQLEANRTGRGLETMNTETVVSDTDIMSVVDAELNINNKIML